MCLKKEVLRRKYPMLNWSSLEAKNAKYLAWLETATNVEDSSMTELKGSNAILTMLSVAGSLLVLLALLSLSL